MATFQPNPLEAAVGWLWGYADPAGDDAALQVAPASPVAALEAVILPALERGRCFVAFSGGRDSSLVLALATRLARRQGLAEPIPLTEVYAGAPDSDEAQWQELVIRHLGCRDWVRLPRGADAELLSAENARSLAGHGLIWPPMAHDGQHLHRQASGGSLLTGEGGDEILGPRRLTPVYRMVRQRQLSLATTRHAAVAVAPAALRRAIRRRRSTVSQLCPWLTDAALAEVVPQVEEDDVAEPLSWARAVQRHRRQRSTVANVDSSRMLGSEHGTVVCDPLLDEHFIAALARAGGFWGLGSRTRLLAILADGTLPQPVIERRTKATFNQAAFGPACREFVARWSGGGVDEALVDVRRLRQEWHSAMPSAMSYTLLHQAWLAEHSTATADAS